MKFSYKFSNLFGTVYHRGNLLFAKDGNTVISPVGNKVSLFDLKNNKSETLPIESRYNITNVALSPCGNLLVIVDEVGEALICSLISKSILTRHHFIRKIYAVKFSPDGKYIAFAKGDAVFIFYAPCATIRHFNAFTRVNAIQGFHDDVVCVEWSSDSRIIVAGSKDMSIRIAGVHKIRNMGICCLGGHQDSIVGCFLEENSMNLYSISRNATVNVWECNVALADLQFAKDSKSTVSDVNLKNVETDNSANEQSSDMEVDETSDDTDQEGSTDVNKYDKVYFTKTHRHYARKDVQGDGFITLTATAFHQKTNILITGFSNGAFFLHEMPEFNLIHSLSIAEQMITSISFNSTGEWIAIGCGNLGQLIVWEWQSETYVLKQQGHFNNMKCLAYSPDGHCLATGGDDGKVKLWNLSSGFCYATFTEHTSGVTAVMYSQNGKVIISASLDGTVRAFDLTRYRNFRTFTSPRPSQFASLAIDSSGEIVCAGSLDNFEIFVWSMQNGRLLEVLSGHEAPVSSLTFSSSESVLVSGSWDKTFKIWDVFSGKSSRETVTMTSDVLAVAFRPDGLEIATATLNGQIAFFNVATATQTASIEGRNDLGSGRRETDLVTAKQVLKAKGFTTLCYTADGQCILAAGQSKHVCIYHIGQQILLKKFEITQNHSLDSMDEFFNRRKMTEFGNLALVEARDPDDSEMVTVALPGVKRGDMASRSFKPEVLVTCVKFSPSGRSWAAATTEGLLLYSLDQNLVFDPLELETNITIASIRNTLLQREYSRALMMALKLSEHQLVVEVVESIRPNNVELEVSSFSDKYVERLIEFLTKQLESSPHLEFYLFWVQTLLMMYGQRLKNRSMHVLSLLNNLQRTLHHKQQSLEKICDHNKYSLQYIVALGKLKTIPTEISLGDEDRAISNNEIDLDI